MRQIASLGLADARDVIAAGEKKAHSLGIPYNIAVVDAGGGALGASGGTVDQDVEVAEAAAAAFKGTR